MSITEKVKEWESFLSALVKLGLAIGALVAGVIAIDKVFASPAQTRANTEHIQMHHDTLEALEAFDSDLHKIQEVLTELKQAQEEYQDSAIASRQRRFCRENPTQC